MASDGQNEIPKQLEKELARALKNAKLEIKLKSVGQPIDLGVADGAASASDQTEQDLSKPDYYGQVESPQGDNLSEPSPALDINKKKPSPEMPSSFDEPSEGGEEEQPKESGSSKEKPGKKKSKSIGPGPQEFSQDGEQAEGEKGKEGEKESTDGNEGAEAGSEPGQATDGQPGQPPSLDKQAGGGQEKTAFGEQKQAGEAGAEGGEQPAGEQPDQASESEDKKPEAGQESAEPDSGQHDKISARILRKEKAEQKKQLKKQEQEQAKAMVEQAIKKVSSKFGLRSLNYGCGASLIGVLAPFVIMNAQLAFTLFPILLKVLPIPKNLADILKFEFGDIGDMFDLLLIILIDVLLAFVIMIVVGIIYWVVNIITHPLKFLWALITDD